MPTRHPAFRLAPAPLGRGAGKLLAIAECSLQPKATAKGLAASGNRCLRGNDPDDPPRGRRFVFLDYYHHEPFWNGCRLVPSQRGLFFPTENPWDQKCCSTTTTTTPKTAPQGFLEGFPRSRNRYWVGAPHSEHLESVGRPPFLPKKWNPRIIRWFSATERLIGTAPNRGILSVEGPGSRQDVTRVCGCTTAWTCLSSLVWAMLRRETICTGSWEIPLGAYEGTQLLCAMEWPRLFPPSVFFFFFWDQRHNHHGTRVVRVPTRGWSPADTGPVRSSRGKRRFRDPAAR